MAIAYVRIKRLWHWIGDRLQIIMGIGDRPYTAIFRHKYSFDLGVDKYQTHRKTFDAAQALRVHP
jgi:hypothetical protein